MPDDSDQRVRTLAVALTAAERVATQRQRVDAARPFLLTALGAGAVAVVALLLPWVSGTPTYRNGVELGWWLPAITVLAGIGFASISLTTPPWIGTHGLRSVVVTIGIVVAISAAAAAVAATNDTGEDVLWPGPITFLLATVVTTAASVAGFANRGASAVDLLQYERGLGEAEVRARIAAAPPDDGVRHRPWPLIVGTGGLLLAAAGLLGPWERITGPAARALTDGGSLVRLGPELATTYALRWVVVGVLVAALLVAAVPQIRRALPVVLVASGVVIIVFAARAAASTSARGLTAELEPGTGVWLFLAGGVLAVLGGAAVAVRRNRTPVVTAVLIALTVAPAWTPPPARADAGSATLLFGASDYDARVGGSVRTAGVDTSEEDGVNAVADPAGGVWFLTSTRLRGRRVTVVQQQVGDRALPVTVLLTGFYDTKLLAVSGYHAIVQSDEDVINRID